ncbi:oxidation resistance protein 1-like isoform X1 [Megalops cyprinoides]|uniref:oxidation resistance protein 1-like isoform X1 n=1 Tax=Megalops cyprinoides TaxID=118141 RepID=UPI001864050F|nr:oxidation resistance protein 1-like isoform X1 [Megalops cyprinoides]XP_036411354.1 oxidation resistance protein 1-like isoform X1 [Megalops cyprinoides]
MFSTKRLKKKSQSVDITAQGYTGPLVKDSQASQINKTTAPVAKTTVSAEQENNATNSQKVRSPRRSDLKRYYTIDTGQKKTPEKKDGRRMSFQRPKGTMEYSVESRDTLNSIALKFDSTPNELVQLNKLFSRAVVPGQVLYVPDPEYISSVESSPTLSPISPLSPTSSEADIEKVTTDSEGVPRKEATPSPAPLLPRPVRVVSSTSEEEEALTEKFLKINCKYITDGKGAVSGVLLVTPNNIMFDPHKADPLVQARGCEEYGIMCPLEEVTSAAMFKEVTDSKIRESVPPDLEPLSSGRDPCQLKRIPRSNTDEAELRQRDTGNDSASTAPRSTEESLSEDVFTESELSPIREELVSSDELRQDKSSNASSESVQTVNQAQEAAAECGGPVGQPEGEGDDPEPSQSGAESPTAVRRHSAEHAPDATASSDPASTGKMGGAKSRTTSESQGSDTVAANPNTQEGTKKGELAGKGARDSKTGEEGDVRERCKSDSMQQAKDQVENAQPTNNKATPAKQEGDPEQQNPVGGLLVPKEKRRHRSHKFLCLRVGKPMRKTFVSHASASMQQYAQRDRKHEYWFAIPQERSDHLYVFFIQWSPDMFGEGIGGLGREPGFTVVKKNEESERGEDDQPITDITAKEWEITTKEDLNSNHGPSIQTELEPETFRPNLSEPSDLLQADQIEKLAKNLPPRTIGYPWNLAFSTSKHGMSLKTLYRTMQGQDTPVLLVIKDSDGQVFGALASEPFKVSDGFYGTGETFLFTFCPDFEVFKWTGDNMFFIKGDMDSLAFGGGGGEFGLWLDGDLYHGRSHSCKTFGNPMLSKKEDFFVQDIEIWSFE